MKMFDGCLRWLQEQALYNIRELWEQKAFKCNQAE